MGCAPVLRSTSARRSRSEMKASIRTLRAKRMCKRSTSTSKRRSPTCSLDRRPAISSANWEG
eukprot:5894309-Prorocentrum_lima.AAC.1